MVTCPASGAQSSRLVDVPKSVNHLLLMIEVPWIAVRVRLLVAITKVPILSTARQRYALVQMSPRLKESDGG